MYKFLLCRAGAFSPFQAAISSSCRHLETPSARNPSSASRNRGGPSPRPAACVGRGKPGSLESPENRELEPANAPCTLRHKSCPAALPNHSQQLCARSQHCRVLKGCKDFLSVQSQKQNTQHWQPPDKFYQETTTFPQPLLPCASLCCPISHWEGQQAPANTPGLWAPRPRARPRAHRTLWPGSACSDFL